MNYLLALFYSYLFSGSLKINWNFILSVKKSNEVTTEKTYTMRKYIGSYPIKIKCNLSSSGIFASIVFYLWFSDLYLFLIIFVPGINNYIHEYLSTKLSVLILLLRKLHPSFFHRKEIQIILRAITVML